MKLRLWEHGLIENRGGRKMGGNRIVTKTLGQLQKKPGPTRMSQKSCGGG